MSKNKGVAVWYCNTEKEYDEELEEREKNLDLHLVGYYDAINDIYDELEYQGFIESEITQLTHNRYGNILDIIEYNSGYAAFIGVR